MKTTISLFASAILFLLFSCGKSNENKPVEEAKIDTLQKDRDHRLKESEERRKQVREGYRLDSIRDENVLKEALAMAAKTNENTFYRKYSVMPDSIPVDVEMSFDYRFTKIHPHLMIRRNSRGMIYIDIYSKKANNFERMLSYSDNSLAHTNDTIRDINGDGLKDFVVNGYAMSGCCLKGFSEIYLLCSDNRSFSKCFHFINPTFAPKEKIIRGICYGHLGDTEMYKYRWNAEKIDTLEYVFYEKNSKGQRTGKVITAAKRPYDGRYKVVRTLNSVPAEYHKIEGYDWFTGD